MSDKNPQPNNPVPEMTPEWLRKLLFKYGENEGILSGAHKRPDSLPEPTEAFSNATTDISGLIASIDETLPADHQELSMAVDWDDPLIDDTGSSPAMDDLLASLREAGTDVDDLTTDLDFESSKDTTEETDSFSSMGNTDWFFSEEKRATDNLPDTDKNEAEVPDWLTEFSDLDEANAETAIQEDDEAPLFEDDTPSVGAIEPDDANFDWLDELSDAEELSIEDESLPALAVDDLPSDDDEEDFSWLDDVTPTGTNDGVETTSESPILDADEAWDADWLATVAQHYPADPTVKPDMPASDEDDAVDDFTLTEIEAFDDENLVPDLPQIDATEPEEVELSDTEPLTDAIPDWLTNLRDTAADEIETEADVETDESSVEEDVSDLFGEMPNWLTEAQMLEDDEIEADKKATLDDDLSEPHRPTLTDELKASTVPDWLSNLRESSEADVEIQAEADIGNDESLAGEDISALFAEMPDWLTEAQNVVEDDTEIRRTAEDNSPEPKTPALSNNTPTEPFEIPGELDNLDNTPETETSPEIETKADVEIENDVTEEDSVALFDELPDWLIEAQNTEQNAPESEEILFTAGNVPTVPEQPALADETDEDNLSIESPTIPDWLNNLRETSSSSEETTLEPEAENATDLSDVSALFDDVPDWLGEELSKETPEAQVPVEDDAPQEQPALADEPWLLSGHESEKNESKAIDLSALEFDDSEVEATEAPTDELLFDDDFTDVADTHSENVDDFAIDVPDWMKNLNLDEPDDFSFDDIEIDAPEAVQLPPDDSDPFSSIDEIDADEHVDESQESASLLSELQAISDIQDTEAETEASEATFSPSDIEADVPDDEPLSDLVALPEGVQSTDEKTLAMEDARDFYGIVQPLPSTPAALETPKTVSLFGKIMRAIFGLIFIALIAIPLFSHFDRGGYPFPWLEPSSDMQGLIQLELQNVVGKQIPGNVALVAFDFTPTTEGEMNPLATIVLKKILGQGMRVVAVSLEPEGTGMIETIFDAVRTDATADSLVNVGYLPGGPIAIRAISAEDAFANLRDVQSGKPLSQMNDWSDVADFSDVDLLVDIAANADTARWWVEQNTVTDTPRLAVVSAAAEPFVRPYRRSLQYDSLIAGINGAAALEASRRQETLSPATAMLDSQSVAHILIMILMLGGTIAGWIAKYGQESD